MNHKEHLKNSDLNKVLSSDPLIIRLTEAGNFADASNLLLQNQKETWKKLSEGYEGLKNVETKSFQFSGFKIKVQYNPGRITSTAAKVDPKSISDRKCFLCISNLPEEQKGIMYNKDFLILANPFPIFPEHFTITHINHSPQEIYNSFSKMLSLSKDLAKYYTIIYNGPECGASAPDHLHLQAGSKFFIPLDNEFHSIKNEYGEIIFENDSAIVSGIDDSLRRFISIETANARTAEKIFYSFYDIYKKVSPDITEPMMNILSFYEEEYGWRILIFLREKHRPSHYFREGNENLLLSPAASDMGGLCITPLEKDFDKISREQITDVFHEISLGKEKFDYIKSVLKQHL